MTCRTAAVLLALLTVLPAQTALADTAGPLTPGPESPRAPATAAVPLEGLVPGVASGTGQPWQGLMDTPDQMLAPQVYTPSAREDAVEPRDASAGADDLIEYVPASEAADRAPSCSGRTGPYQRQVERGLRRKADGKQSGGDCRAIRAFQVRHGIRPSTGFAGPVTWARMRLLSARKNPNAAGRCPVRASRVACVDLARQLTWVQKGTKVLWGPVPMRSGRAGYRTRTGLFTIYWKHKNHWSTLYNSPMPYSQFFSGGQAFHAVYGSIYDPHGSWGCVNLRLADARSLWNVLRKGDRVSVWGRRAGT
ncbi:MULTISPECIES: L,D-transpeptidase family protein [unclassified Streptomyces]|uniref:L,D-transpeptidase family protein n=1 Tax=unclassified Streptomyces TaxID=2593676 RepID=UPI00331CADD5